MTQALSESTGNLEEEGHRLRKHFCKVCLLEI